MKRFFNRWILMGIVLFAIGGFLLFQTYQQGEQAGEQASELLQILEETKKEPESIRRQTKANPKRDNKASQEKLAEPKQIIEEKVSAKSKIPVKKLAEKMIGKITIPSLGVTLPILEETTDELLKVSVCRYKGPLPGENGNLVIAGHNYLSGDHFGRLGDIQDKADVIVTGLDGEEYTFQVYKKKVVAASDVESVDQKEGEMSVTLFTCKEQGKKRLVVYCRKKS